MFTSNLLSHQIKITAICAMYIHSYMVYVSDLYADLTTKSKCVLKYFSVDILILDYRKDVQRDDLNLLWIMLCQHLLHLRLL